MNKDVLGEALANVIIDDKASDEMKARITALWKSLADVIISHIKDNAVISVPTGEVVISVTGQATGTANPKPIDCTIQ